LNSKLKIAFLTDDDPVNQLVVREIADSFPPSLVLQVHWESGASSSLRKRLSPSKLAGLHSAMARRWVSRRRERWLEQHLASSNASFPGTENVSSSEINGKKTASLLAKHSIDVLMVCGGPILRPRIFSLPKIATINIHFGISSAYRGHHTLFWPLWEQQLEDIGATVHLIDEGVDTGQTLIEYRPAIGGDDNEFSLELKVARGVVRPTVEMLNEVAQSDSSKLVGQAQSNHGKQIFFKDRGLCNSIGLALREKFGNRTGPELPERTKKFFEVN
jgi:folate-dependent phosphoribosylglycinamide formyltransferase PurN